MRARWGVGKFPHGSHKLPPGGRTIHRRAAFGPPRFHRASNPRSYGSAVAAAPGAAPPAALASLLTRCAAAPPFFTAAFASTNLATASSAALQSGTGDSTNATASTKSRQRCPLCLNNAVCTPATCNVEATGAFKFVITTFCPCTDNASAKSTSMSQAERSTRLMDLESSTTYSTVSPMDSRNLAARMAKSLSLPAFAKWSAASMRTTTALCGCCASGKYRTSRQLAFTWPQTTKFGVEIS
mmetsp:Transcript_13196/g.37993  ORF Transcript_13196/g.37993 Transcript_13196/m.37993 type:complete len:241 (+) Transcript_13196:137-859(+)